MAKDTIYATASADVEPFRFDARVADVFPDMLRRSIPGYSASLEAIGSLAGRFVTAGSNCYDLGCSLGAATLAMRQGIRAPGCKIIGIDNSTAMVERCRQLIAEDDAADPMRTPVEIVLADIHEAKMADAAMVVMNYTLQFLDLPGRDELVARIYDSLNPGGLFLLSEKIIDEDPDMEVLLVELYHEHKRRNAYSELEISRKRAALENVLIPETVAAHRLRIASAGFAHAAVWLRYFNFVSIVAIK